MTIKAIAANQTELTLDNGDIVLFSYQTPVAAFVSGKGILRTEAGYSQTTTKHINAFIKRTNPNSTVTVVPQEEIEEFVSYVKYNLNKPSEE
jgi:hypothetical protein